MKRTMSIMGRLGADPQMKETANGTPYLQFRFANNAFGDPEGSTAWFTATVWEGRCMKMAKSLKKGSLVEVEGDYSDRLYTNKKTGNVEIGRDITVTAIYFAGSPKDENNAANPNAARTEAPATDSMPTEARTSVPTAQPAASAAPITEEVSNDDLPF